jgi:hypothetical protein
MRGMSLPYKLGQHLLLHRRETQVSLRSAAGTAGTTEPAAFERIEIALLQCLSSRLSVALRHRASPQVKRPRADVGAVSVSTGGAGHGGTAGRLHPAPLAATDWNTF